MYDVSFFVLLFVITHVLFSLHTDHQETRKYPKHSSTKAKQSRLRICTRFGSLFGIYFASPKSFLSELKNDSGFCIPLLIILFDVTKLKLSKSTAASITIIDLLTSLGVFPEVCILSSLHDSPLHHSNFMH